MTDTQPLTNKTLERLRALVKGNGLAAERVTVIESSETVHTVHGFLKVQPHLDIQTSTTLGRVKGKGVKLFPTFAAMETEIEEIRTAFHEGMEWMAKAQEELAKTSGKGWGEEGTDVVWDKEATHLAASENCPTCRGSATSTCPHCQGLGYNVCPYCEGRGKEICPNCGGAGTNPANPATPCPVCRGERYAACRYCHLTGKLTCEQCGGKATLPCTACKGTGYMSHEAIITKKATLQFSLGETTSYPSGLLRMMQRAGMDKLGGTLADIEMTRPSDAPDSDVPPNVLQLTARIPYAEIKMKIGSKQGKIIAFGKTGRLSGVPPFLDEILLPARGLLIKAAKGEFLLEKVLGLRAMKNALALSLEGKTNPNELRRLYPVGLTPDVAKEIMMNMGLALRTQTKPMRQTIGWGYAAACGALFAGLMFTPLSDKIMAGRDLVAALSLHLLLLAATLGGGWLVLSNAAHWALKQKYPTAKISHKQETGHTGSYIFATILALYLALFVLSGQPAIFR